MAINISTELQEALDNPERYGVILITATLGSNVFGFWTGGGVVTYNTIPYYNAGSVIEVDDVQQNADGSVAELTLRLNSQPDKGLADDVLESFYDEAWQFGRVVIQEALLDPITREIVGAVTLIRGVIIEAPEHIGPDGTYIAVRVTTSAIKLSENGGMYRNASTQKALDPADTSLEGIGNLGGAITKEMKWGQG
jgi:hypothetical protein